MDAQNRQIGDSQPGFSEWLSYPVYCGGASSVSSSIVGSPRMERRRPVSTHLVGERRFCGTQAAPGHPPSTKGRAPGFLQGLGRFSSSPGDSDQIGLPDLSGLLSLTLLANSHTETRCGCSEAPERRCRGTRHGGRTDCRPNRPRAAPCNRLNWVLLGCLREN